MEVQYIFIETILHLNADVTFKVTNQTEVFAMVQFHCLFELHSNELLGEKQYGRKEM